jgi:hypothetical protein
VRPNHTKARLQAGETALGCFLRYPDATLVEVVGYQPWDFVVFDGEHGTLEPAACEHMVRAAELRDVTSIVRVPTNQAPAILRLLDTGAQGAQVPWINTAPEAEAAVRAIKYHPRGVRGLAGVRASDYGLAGTLAEYTDRANRETLVVLQVETSRPAPASGCTGRYAARHRRCTRPARTGSRHNGHKCGGGTRVAGARGTVSHDSPGCARRPGHARLSGCSPRLMPLRTLCRDVV